jgi:hypothetical protein
MAEAPSPPPPPVDGEDVPHADVGEVELAPVSAADDAGEPATAPSFGISVAARVAASLKNKLAIVRDTSLVVSRAAALEHVQMTHPRIPTAKLKTIVEPVFEMEPGGRLVIRSKAVTYVSRSRYKVCQVRTGWFCCGCSCGSAESDFSAYGSLVTSHFKVLKALFVIFLLATLASLPVVVINALGRGEATASLPSFFRTTAGNLGDSSFLTNVTLPDALCLLVREQYPLCQVPKSHIARFEAISDAFISGVFIVAFVALRFFAKSEQDRVDDSTVEISDFSVFLPSIPAWLTKKRINDHFSALLNGPSRPAHFPKFRIAKINVVDDGFKRLKLFLRKARIDEALHKLNSKIAQTRLLRLVHGDNEQCCCTRREALQSMDKRKRQLQAEEYEARRKIVKYSTAHSTTQVLETELKELREEQAAVPADKKQGGCCARNFAKEIARKEREVETAKLAAAKLGRDPSEPDEYTSVAAFVMFENDDDCREVRRLYPDAICFRGCCQPNSLRVKGPAGELVPLEVRDAPDPTTILWENLAVNGLSQLWRRALTLVAAVTLLSVSFVALYGASIAQAQLQFDTEAADCRGILQVMNATTTGNTSLSWRSPDGSFDPSVQAIWPVVRTYLLAHRGVADALLNPASRNRSMQACYCQSVSWIDLNLQDLEGSSLSTECPDQYCPRLALLALDKAAAASTCTSWVESYALQTGLTALASIVVVVVNNVIGITVDATSRFDAYYSEDELNATLSIKSLAVRLFNTAILSLLVNAYFPGVSRVEDAHRLHHDLTSSWYESVGASLALTMTLQIVTSNLPVLTTLLQVYLRRKTTIAATQEDLNARYSGPPFDPNDRLGAACLFVCIALVFGAGIPILYLITCVYLLVSYWVDLFGFANVYRTPSRLSNAALLMMLDMLPFALLLHLGMALWTYSFEPIFTSDVSSTEMGFDSRVASSWVLPLLILLAVVCAVLAIRVVLVTLFGGAVKSVINLMCTMEAPDLPVTLSEARDLAEKKLPGLLSRLEAAESARDAGVLTRLPQEEMDVLNKAITDVQAELHEVRKHALTTLVDYNPFRVPRIIKTFHLPPGFADRYEHLNDLAHFTPAAADELVRRHRKSKIVLDEDEKAHE